MSVEPPRLVHTASRPADASHRASEWFALIQGGAPTPTERAELAQWLAADPRNAQAYAQLEQLWEATALLAQPVAQAPQLSRRRFVGLGLAASVAVVASGATTLWFKGISAPFADVRTAVGERRTLQLPDGSTVELAGNTALNLNFSATQRAVELLQGEAFFQVVPTAAGEFSVQTQAGRVLLGDGECCLACDGASAQLSVSRHSVRVITPNQQTDLGEGLSLRFSSTHTGAIQRAELEQVLAWRNGRLVFFDTPLLTVVNQLQRWREGKIFIPDAQLAARRVSLILNLNRPDQMLDVLSKALAVRTTRYTDLITLIQPA
jgi:transmembrane sensor